MIIQLSTYSTMTIKLKASPKKKKQPAATETSNSINEQINAFLEAGGQIEKINSGVSGQVGLLGSRQITIEKKS